MRIPAAVLLLAAAGVYAPFASAFTDPNGVFSAYTGGKTTVTPPVTNSSWTAGVSGSNIKASANATLAARNGKTVTAPIGKVLTPAVARKMTATALRAIPLIGTGIVAWELYHAFGVDKDAEGNLDYDAGIPTTTITVNCWKRSGVTMNCFLSAAAAAQAAVDVQFAGYNLKTATIDSCPNANFCWVDLEWRQASSGATSTADKAWAVVNSPTTQQGCSDGSPVRRDGKCKGGTIQQNITDEQAAEKLTLGSAPASLAEMTAGLESAFDYSIFQLDKPMVVGPVPNVNVGNTVQVTGNPPVTTTTTETDIGTDDGDGDVDWTTQTSDGTTTETKPADKEKPLDPCGLPTTPPCVIDEGKTPKTEVLTDAAKASADAQKARIDAISTVTQASGKQTAWAWNLATPTNCVPLAVDMRVGSIGRVVTLDPCAYQSVFHDLMSMAWAGVTLFFVFGMVGRTLREV